MELEENAVKFKADVMWAFFDKVNEMSGRYGCDFTNLDEKTVEALEAVGLTPRKREDKPEKGWFLTVKSSKIIEPVDKQGNRIKDTIGNGSKAVALIKPYSWTWKNKTGISPTLVKIVVTDLVKYNGASNLLEDLDDDIL